MSSSEERATISRITRAECGVAQLTDELDRLLEVLLEVLLTAVVGRQPLVFDPGLLEVKRHVWCDVKDVADFIVHQTF